MASKSEDEISRRRRSRHHRTAILRSARGRVFAPRPVTLWPFAEADPLPGTARLAGWLGRAIVALVTGYTRPGDRVLLLEPTASAGSRVADPYAGLAEAVWTVARLGRTADTSFGRGVVESGTGSRLSRLGLRAPVGLHHESECNQVRFTDRFDLIIAAVHSRSTDWLAAADWDTVLTPAGVLAIVTHCDSRDGRLLDPTAAIVKTVGSQRRAWLDHIAVLDKPLPVVPMSQVANGQALPPRSVHHDLLVFGPVPAEASPFGNDHRGDLG